MTIGQIGPRYSPQRFDGPLTVGETRDYALTVPAQDIPQGSTITSASLAIAPNGTAECSIVTATLSGPTLTARITAGQPRIYTQLWTFVLNGGPPVGQKLEYLTEIACNPALPDQVATDPDSAGFGTPKTVTP